MVDNLINWFTSLTVFDIMLSIALGSGVYAIALVAAVCLSHGKGKDK